MVANDFGFRYEEAWVQPDWQLAEGDTTILGYACNKARCVYRGREWTAWYALELTTDAGPWKLAGLPGLILAAHDASGAFSFTATGLDRGGSNKAITFDQRRYEVITPRGLQQLKRDYWHDQWNTRNRLEGRPWSRPSDAQGVFTACFIETYE